MMAAKVLLLTMLLVESLSTCGEALETVLLQ